MAAVALSDVNIAGNAIFDAIAGGRLSIAMRREAGVS